MKSWSLTQDDPGSYVISADIRCGPTDYTNDHIWELNLEGGEPAALALQTTFGLRARNFRLFPRFVEGDTGFTDPSDFSARAIIRHFFPNYLCVDFSPFMGIDVRIEYWVPDSHTVTGQARITNSRLSAREIRFEWAALLSPNEGGERMAVTEIQAVNVLVGETANLHPVIFMTGGPEPSSGPYPALSVNLNLAAGGTRRLTWVHTALDSPEESFEHARNIATRKWSAEIARLEVINAGLIEIETGDADWDAAFALSQKEAFRAMVGPTEQLPFPSMVLSRQPDHGFSQRGDGSDYGYLWSGQPVFETFYLCNLLLPAAPHLAEGLLRNFYRTQSQSGHMDWKPGLGGQRGNLLATPLLVNLTWKIAQHKSDRKAFFKETFQRLIDFVQVWFSSDQDRDGDGIPEWSHSMQSGFEDHPVFSLWQNWSQGADITKSESPSLCAYLYKEIQTLQKIAREIERTEASSALQAFEDLMKSATQAAWNEATSCYHHWDRETHHSPAGETLFEGTGPGEVCVEQEFDQPVRLMIKIEACEDIRRSVNASIHGTSASGMNRIEMITSDRFKWFLGNGNATSDRVYSAIDFIQIDDIADDDRVSIQVVDYAAQDQTLFLPLWAGIPEQDQAADLVFMTLTNPQMFNGNFGVTACIKENFNPENPICTRVHIPWNTLIGQGLLAYGFREEAVMLVSKLMSAVIKNLKEHKAFFASYQSDDGRGSGEAHAITGLAPVELFLDTLGVNILSSKAIQLQDFNPFPWSVTIRYQGLTIQREKVRTKITFPGGQTVIVKNPELRLITIEDETES